MDDEPERNIKNFIFTEDPNATRKRQPDTFGATSNTINFPLAAYPCAAFEAGVYYIGTQDSEDASDSEALALPLM